MNRVRINRAQPVYICFIINLEFIQVFLIFVILFHVYVIFLINISCHSENIGRKL